MFRCSGVSVFRSHFGSSRHCSRVFVCCSLVLLCICQPRQSMGRIRKWVLEDSLSEAVWRTILRGPRPPATAWSRASNRSVAKSAEQKFPSPTKVSTVGPGTVSLCTTTFAPCQQASRESGSRRSRGDREVEGGDICIGRVVDTLKTSARSLSSSSGSCISASNPGASGFVQALLGTCQETRASRAGGHRQST